MAVVSIAFWILYSLSPSALTIFIENHVFRSYDGFKIPTPVYYTLNPIACIVFGYMMTFVKAKWFTVNSAKNVFIKLSWALILAGIGYSILYPAIVYFGVSGKVDSSWIVISYFLQSAAEILIGPLGFALVGMFVPKIYESTIQGFWALMTGTAASISSFVAINTYSNIGSSQQQAIGFGREFLMYGALSVGVGVTVLLVTIAIVRFVRNDLD
jgi:POT family proton-dependent oligopeptide transporter